LKWSKTSNLVDLGFGKFRVVLAFAARACAVTDLVGLVLSAGFPTQMVP
jgi:hypothetical protein